MGLPAVACSEFCFSYGKSLILDRISFSLERGQWLSIVGTNGSGKSTLLKNMLRLIDGGKSSGTIAIAGRDLSTYSQRELAQAVAYVPQAGGRVPPFTVRDFVNLSRFPYGYRAESRKNEACESVEEALRLTNTKGLGHRRMDALSGGQRQRVYLAAALAQDTDIILLDEPASFLDPRHAHEMHETLKKLNSESGLTIITVTHDLNQVLDAGGMALVLADSKQIYFGKAEALAEGKGILESAFAYPFVYLTHPVTHKRLVVA